VKRSLALGLLGAWALLGGCAAFDRPAPPAETSAVAPAASTRRSNADEMAVYLARVRGMNDGALAAEAARQRRDASDLGRLKAALALAMSVQAEEADILALVDPLAKKDNGDPDVRAMASFLQVVAGERRRLKESAAAAGVRLRDERRLHEAQKQRADTLQQKLDALTDLEKSLSDRPTPTR
jgi:hypothetical protein